MRGGHRDVGEKSRFSSGIVSIPRVLQLVSCCTLVVRTVSVRFHSELPEIALVLVTIRIANTFHCWKASLSDGRYL